MLEQGLDLEDLGRRVDVYAAQGEFGPTKRLPYGLTQLRLVHTKLADRPAHAHPRAHELGFRVDPEPHPDALACLPGYVREAVDLVYRLDVDGEDALVYGAPELVIGLARPCEDDVLWLEAGGPSHRQLPRGGDLGPCLPLRGYELAYPEARVRLERVGDLRPEGFVDAADPLGDHLPVVEVEGRPVVLGYPGDGYACGGELAPELPPEALRQLVCLIRLSKHC